MRCPRSFSSSVGIGPFPTRDVYAFTTPITSPIRVPGTPVPAGIPSVVQLELVMNGCVP